MFSFCSLFSKGREMGTIRYFREKLQRRNVTQDVKHYEDCEELFLSIGRCFAVEALISFFLAWLTRTASQLIRTGHPTTY